MNLTRTSFSLVTAVIVGSCFAAPAAYADTLVAVVAEADAAYRQKKFEGDEARTETYVFMEGSYFSGVTVDTSIERMTFRELVGYLAPQLAKQEYLPTADPAAADLVLLVHWGTTRPKVSTRDMKAWTGDDLNTETRISALGQAMEKMGGMGGGDAEKFIPDQMSITGDAAFDSGLQVPAGHEAAMDTSFDQLETATSDLSDSLRTSGNMDLLGYRKEMFRLGKTPSYSEDQRTLDFDLRTERYFVIIEAFAMEDIKASKGGGRRPRPVWKIHLNISSPGNNFQTAMSRMSAAGADFFGHDLTKVSTVRAKVNIGRVDILPFTIIGEVK